MKEKFMSNPKLEPIVTDTCSIFTRYKFPYFKYLPLSCAGSSYTVVLFLKKLRFKILGVVHLGLGTGTTDNR